MYTYLSNIYTTRDKKIFVVVRTVTTRDILGNERALPKCNLAGPNSCQEVVSHVSHLVVLLEDS